MNAAPERCQACHVRASSLCGALSDDELHALSMHGRRKTLPRGQVVSWSGDPNTLMANVVAGALKVTASTEDGREQIVGLLYPSDLVGQPFAEEAELTVTTLTDTDLCTFHRPAFERTLDAHPRMERVLLRRTLETLEDARRRMLSLGRRSAQERVAGFLLEVAERSMPDHAGDRVSILIPIGRGEMADFLGLTIETVSRQLTRLKTAGILAFDKGDRDCTILSRAALRAAANPD